MDLEQELYQALTRKDPPPGFADRVAAREHNRHGGLPTRWLAFAASVVLLMGAGAAWRQHQGEVAKDQVMTAMKITAVKLNRIQTHVREIRQ